MNIYVSTANNYLNILKPYAFLMNKFWPDREVNILGYDKPTFNLPNNFNFISMGKQEGGIKKWSTDLRKFFETVVEDYFIWNTEDQLLTTEVDFDILEKLTSLLHENVGRISLTNDMPLKPFDIIESCGMFDIIERRQNVEYRISAVSSIWNKKYLLKYLQPEWSPWEFEIYGSDLARNDGYRILGTYNKYALHQSCGIRHGNLETPLDFNGINHGINLDQEIIDEMIEKGVISEGNNISK